MWWRVTVRKKYDEAGAGLTGFGEAQDKVQARDLERVEQYSYSVVTKVPLKLESCIG